MCACARPATWFFIRRNLLRPFFFSTASSRSLGSKPYARLRPCLCRFALESFSLWSRWLICSSIKIQLNYGFPASWHDLLIHYWIYGRVYRALVRPPVSLRPAPYPHTQNIQSTRKHKTILIIIINMCITMKCTCSSSYTSSLFTAPCFGRCLFHLSVLDGFFLRWPGLPQISDPNHTNKAWKNEHTHTHKTL